jgi:hypothetical protein
MRFRKCNPSDSRRGTSRVFCRLGSRCLFRGALCGGEGVCVEGGSGRADFGSFVRRDVSKLKSCLRFKSCCSDQNYIMNSKA